MSQEDSPIQASTMNPVGTQEASMGAYSNIEDAEKVKTAQALHETALRDRTPESETFKKAVEQAVRDQFEVTSAWQPRNIVKFIIDCPSGQKALVKHLETMDLVRADLVEELDFFTKKLFPQSIDAAGNPVEREEDSENSGIWEILRDPEKRARFWTLSNKLMVASSIKPKIIDDGVAIRINQKGEKEDVFGYEIESITEQIELFGKPVPELGPGECYAGPIDFSDRMAFFSELNKPLELIEPFREKSNAMLEHLEPIEADRGTSERYF